MKKSLIIGILIGGICGNIIAPVAQPVEAGTIIAKSTLAENAPKLKVLNTGAEPRRELRFRPAVNSKQTMIMTMGMSMNMKIGENSFPKIPIPKMVMKLDLNVRKVDLGGDIYYSFAYTDIKVVADKDTPPELLAATEKTLKSLIGVKGDIVINSSGEIKSKKLFLPKTIDKTVKSTLEQFDRSIDQLSNRFPREMLGLGAKWQMDNALQYNGMKLNQSSTYEIVKIDETGMTIKTQIMQSSPPQDISLPKVGKAKVKLVSLNSNGEGSYTIRFDSLLPIAGGLLINTDSQMSIQNNPKEEPVTVVSKIGIDLNFSDK